MFAANSRHEDKFETLAIKQMFDQQQRRDRWAWYHWAQSRQTQQDHIRLAHQAEGLVAEIARSMGFTTLVTNHTHPHDLEVIDSAGRAARVEVKIALPHPNQRKWRYQARLHHHNADVLVFIARNGKDWPFVIPMADICPRTNIAISSYCPGDYSGQWAAYLEAWDHLRQAVQAAQPNPYQMPLEAL